MLIRVFEMPDLKIDGFLFGGGEPQTFLQVDWFRDEPHPSAPDFTTPEGRAIAEQFIRGKNYFRADKAFLVLHPTHPFTIGYTAP